MPVLNGWEFLEQYRHLKQNINKPITLYIVSSTIDPADHQKAKANPNVNGVVVKPLSSQILQDLLCNIE